MFVVYAIARHVTLTLLSHVKDNKNVCAYRLYFIIKGTKRAFNLQCNLNL